MRIEKLSVDNLREGVFCHQGKPHSEEVYDRLEAWLAGDKLRGRIARNSSGEVVGFILYYPIEHAPLDLEGEGVYAVQCVYVKPEYQNTGIGRALIESAVADAREGGASGLAVEGFRQQRPGRFDFLPETFFQHLGMSTSETRGSGTIYYVAFEDKMPAPRYMTPKTQMTPQEKTKVRIDVFDCRACHVGLSNVDVVKAVVEKAHENVDLVVHEQTTRAAIVEKGVAGGVFLDGRLTFFQGPINEDEVWEAIQVAAAARKLSIDR